MNEQKERLMALVDDVKAYLNIRLRLITLDLCERSAKTLASLIANSTVLLFAVLFLLFGSIAAAMAIGECIQSYSLGFAIVAGFYLLLALLVKLLSKKYIQKPLVNKFIKAFLKGTENIDENE